MIIGRLEKELPGEQSSSRFDEPQDVKKLIRQTSFWKPSCLVTSKRSDKSLSGLRSVGEALADFDCNAGRNYPLIMRADGSVETLTGNGLVMGLFSAVQYEVKKTKLARGEMLVLYSDGVTEAADSSDVEFGEKGLAEFLGSVN